LVAVNPAGLVIAIIGGWIVSQVFAGNALERLNILKPDDGNGSIIPKAIPDAVTPYVPGGPKNPAQWWQIPGLVDAFGQN
jgi:hypothetical protein